MGDVLYIQTDKNRKITDPHVRLGDISDLTSNNPEVLQRCKAVSYTHLTLPTILRV